MTGRTAPASAKAKQVAMTAAQAVQQAGRLFTAGHYVQAEKLARQIVRNHPALADAHNILGVSLNALGRTKDAIAALKAAIARAPGSPVFYANLGEIERLRGHGAEARKALMKAIALDPNHASAHNNLGILNYEDGNFEEAAACYRRALEANPGFAEAYNNLGNACRFAGEQEKALGYYEKALQFREHYPEAYNNLGTMLRDLGRVAEAEHAYRKAMLQNPGYIEAYNNLANLLHGDDRDQEALRVLGDALRVEENHPVTLTITSRVQLRRGNFAAAEEAARRAMATDPAGAEAMVALGQVLHEIDRYEEAVGVLRKAVEIAPDSPEARNFYGVALKSVGKLEEGRDQILEALKLNPNNLGAYANLNDVIDFREAPELVEQMEKIFASADNQDDPRLMPLHFGFGKALDDTGQPERAIEHYIKGARLKRRQLSYSEEETFAFFAQIKDAFGPEQFKDRRYAGLSTERPVFIVGMPRSGSTLVEQILASHPDVHGAGEVKYLARGLGQLRDRFPSMDRYPAIFAQMEEFHLELLGKSYLGQIEKDAGQSRRITDKLLTNYFFLGLIHLIFPNAKIIHTRRNPIDTCLSAFTKLFKDDMPHSYDFGELGRYYLQYQALMDHWREMLPEGAIFDVSYEEVVADIEGNARGMIGFLGLDWDPACVDFHKSSRPVKTASVAQVRKPVYTQSVERWRRYGPALQPLLDALQLDGKAAAQS